MKLFDRLRLVFYKKIMRNENKVHDLYRKKGAKIGERCLLLSPIISPENYLINIGNDVVISSNVTLVTHDFSISRVVPNSSDIFGEINIGNNCFIGTGSIILPGIKIGDNSIIGAGSVVTMSVPNDVVVAGNPARIIKSIENFKINGDKTYFNTKGMNKEQKKAYLLANKDKFKKANVLQTKPRCS